MDDIWEEMLGDIESDECTESLHSGCCDSQYFFIMFDSQGFPRMFCSECEEEVTNTMVHFVEVDDACD